MAVSGCGHGGDAAQTYRNAPYVVYMQAFDAWEDGTLLMVNVSCRTWHYKEFGVSGERLDISRVVRARKPQEAILSKWGCCVV